MFYNRAGSTRQAAAHAGQLAPEQKKVIEIVTAPPLDAAGLVGYYSTLAMIMNVARSPPQPNSTAPKLAPFPH